MLANVIRHQNRNSTWVVLSTSYLAPSITPNNLAPYVQKPKQQALRNRAETELRRLKTPPNYFDGFPLDEFGQNARIRYLRIVFCPCYVFDRAQGFVLLPRSGSSPETNTAFEGVSRRCKYLVWSPNERRYKEALGIINVMVTVWTAHYGCAYTSVGLPHHRGLLVLMDD